MRELAIFNRTGSPIEACTLVAGPLSAGILGDLGAEVIKLEPTNGVGDPCRSLGTTRRAEATGELLGAIFHTINRGKRSVLGS